MIINLVVQILFFPIISGPAEQIVKLIGKQTTTEMNRPNDDDDDDDDCDGDDCGRADT